MNIFFPDGCSPVFLFLLCLLRLFVSYTEQNNKCVIVRCSIMFVGESREGTVVKGGFWNYGNGHMELETMTVTNSEWNGVMGGNVDAKEVSFNRCDRHGVEVSGQSMLTNCTVTNCGGSGISTYKGMIHIYGEKTDVTGNCRKGYGCGLDSYAQDGLGVSSLLCTPRIIIHAQSHAPLTKESISHDQYKGGRTYDKQGKNWETGRTYEGGIKEVLDVMYLGEHLVVPYVTAHGRIKRPEHHIAYWSRIFSFLGPSPLDNLRLRWMCRLFRDSLPPPDTVWTMYPHPKHSMHQLVNRINEAAKKDPSKSPSVVYILNGTHNCRLSGELIRQKYSGVLVDCSLTLEWCGC